MFLHMGLAVLMDVFVYAWIYPHSVTAGFFPAGFAITAGQGHLKPAVKPAVNGKPADGRFISGF